VSHGTISRRRLLAVGGAVAVGSLAGCVDRVASSVTDTGSSPAAVFAGAGWNDDETEVTFEMARGSPHVSRLTPTVSGGSGVLSGEVELEGWVTSSAVVATNYNNTRSNRATIRADDGDTDSDADGVDDTIDRVGELEARLRESTTAAVDAISKRSARTGRSPELDRAITTALDEMDETLAALRAVLERCSDAACVVALENVERRETAVRDVRGHVEDEQWDGAVEALAGDETSPIYTGDQRGGDNVLHRDTIAPPDGPLTEQERDAVGAYLGGEPVVGERFTVCLPDAEVPGGDESIAEQVTPERLVEYVTGQSDGGGRVYSWGASKSGPGDPDTSNDCDDDDPGSRPGAVCGTSPHLVADVTGPTATGGRLEVVRADDGTVVVSNSPPDADGGPAVVRVGADGPESSTEAVYQAWSGTSDGGGKATPEIFETLVTQVLAQPPGCPHAFPALLYVGRGRSDGQLVYSGGWVIDDAALYGDSATMLTMVDAVPVVGVDPGDVDADGDGLGDAVERADAERGRRVVAGRSRRGARLDAGTVGELVEKGVLTESGKQGYDSVRRKKPGRRLETAEEPRITHLALDAPVLHLVNASGASNEVKFKAGAELSKAVN
jgi:hypothetical protein